MVEHVTRPTNPKDLTWGPTISTSSFFERIHATTATTTLLNAGAVVPGGVPADGRARVEEALAAGYTLLAPTLAVDVGGSPRYAWWQVDPRSGGTTAVTDEGLHQTAEVAIVNNKDGSYAVWTTVDGVDMAHAARFASHKQAVHFAEPLSWRIVTRFKIDVVETGLWW